VRFTLKEAGLQNPVPTNRNWIQRPVGSDEVAQPVPQGGIILTSKGWGTIKYPTGRSSGYWVKEYVLTWGDLGLHEMETEKSAEPIVVGGT